MTVQTLSEELEAVITNRLKNAFRTDQQIDAADWVSEIASLLAMAVAMVDEADIPQLTVFAHAELTRYIAEHFAERKLLDQSEDDEDDSEEVTH